MCMRMRGVEKQNSVVMTSAMLGVFRKNHETRQEFMNLIRKANVKSSFCYRCSQALACDSAFSPLPFRGRGRRLGLMTIRFRCRTRSARTLRGPLRQAGPDHRARHRPCRQCIHPRARRKRHQGARRADLQRVARSWRANTVSRSLSLADVKQLDADFDGADEVDSRFNLLKGFGGALVREKIVAASSKKFIVLVGPVEALSASRRAQATAGRGGAIRTRLRDARGGEAGDEGGDAQERRRQRLTSPIMAIRSSIARCRISAIRRAGARAARDSGRPRYRAVHQYGDASCWWPRRTASLAS